MCMENKGPTLKESRSLYEAAIKFQKIGCWEWMWENELFGVKDPESGEVGYCSVMGGNKEHFALAVYLGADGFHGFINLESAEAEADAMDAFFKQRSLMASFEDRTQLAKQDREAIKNLGLRFSGKAAWPLFRSLVPGYGPWFVTGAEARRLTSALEQATATALRLREDKNLLPDPETGKLLVRARQQDGSWADENQDFPAEEERVLDLSLAKADIDRIAKLPITDAVWEGDVTLMPPVPDKVGERPRVRWLVKWLDRRSGMILSIGFPEGWEGIRESFLETAESGKRLPKEIAIMHPDALLALFPLTALRGIKLTRAKRLPRAEQAERSMQRMFRRR